VVVDLRTAIVLGALVAACGNNEDATSKSDGGTGGLGGSGGGTGGTGGATGGTGGTVAGGGGASGTGAVGGGGAAGAPSELTLPIRAAFFYPWFPETWGGLADPFTNYHPVAGYYDSSSASIIQGQLEELRYAHVQAAIASWWGQGSKPDGRVAKLLDASAALAASDGGPMIRWALYVEAEGDAVPWGSSDPTSDQIHADLDYVFQNYASHPAFLRLGGKPVLFTWGDAGDDCSSAVRWVTANDAFEAATGQRFYLVMKLFQGYASCAVQPDSWHQYGPAVGYQEHSPFSAVVSPGFWLKGTASPALARDPARFAADVGKMNAADARFKLITTFDEWGEGTAVEPADEWQSASGNGVYLDVLHDQPP
jgi:hypothetical protein